MLMHMLNKTAEGVMKNHGAIKFMRIKFVRSWKREMDEKGRLFEAISHTKMMTGFQEQQWKLHY